MCPYKGNKSLSREVNIAIALLFDPLKKLIVKKLKYEVLIKVKIETT